MKEDFFITNNKKIKLNLEHYQRFKDKTPKDANVIQISNDLKKFNIFSLKEYIRFFDGFYSDLYKFNLACKTIFSNRADKKIHYNNHLDIGSREGFVGMMMKGAGLVQKSSGIDVYDFSNNFLKNFKIIYKLLSKFNLDLKDSYLKTQNEIGVNIDKKLYYKSIAKNDEFTQTSLEDYKPINKKEKFDLITCLATICFINPSKFIKKILSISEIGTELYIYSDNYIFPINSSKVVTKIPYSAQRLSKKDFEKFVDEFHPNKSKFLKNLNGYYMEGNPVSGKRLCKILEENNFRVLSIEYSQTVDWALELLNNDKKNIINDINSMHGDVDEKDLTSRFYWIHAKRIT